MQNDKLFLVETKDVVYYSERKIDAAYKHQEFNRWNPAKYREVQKSKYKFPEGKRKIALNDGTVEEAV